MTSHFGLMVLFSALVATIFSTIAKDTPGEQLQFGLRLLGGFVATGLALSWVMRVFPF